MKAPSVKNKYGIFDVITTKGKNPKNSKFEMTVVSIRYHPEVGIHYTGFDPKTKEPYAFAIAEYDAKLIRKTKHK